MATPSSATGGYLQPAAEPAPLEGQALNRFIQQVVVNITGLPGKMVRPSFQPEPANIPTAGDAWAAIRTSTIPSDTFPAVIHDGAANDGLGEDELQRHEIVNVLTSFYDLGTNGLADKYCSLLRDGLAIAQNREALRLGGMALNSVQPEIMVPVIVKTRWLYRIDLPVLLARQVNRRYGVQNVLSAQGEVVTSAGIVLKIDTDELLPPQN